MGQHADETRFGDRRGTLNPTEGRGRSGWPPATGVG